MTQRDTMSLDFPNLSWSISQILRVSSVVKGSLSAGRERAGVSVNGEIQLVYCALPPAHELKTHRADSRL